MRKAWEIPWSEIEFQEEIGKGAFGVVHAAHWRDLRVAVKSVAGHFADLGLIDSDQSGSDMDREIAMLQQVRHPNIVLLFGAGTSPDGTPFLVTELVELGTLRGYLEGRQVDWGRKISFTLDTARGMAHVHGLGRMHRDLKSGNLLVSASLRVKVADFGTATIASMTCSQPAEQNVDLQLRASTQRTKGVGTPLWMAPEIIEGKAYGPSADVYSFGIVMWEIASQATPWEEIKDNNFFSSTLLKHIKQGQRPVISSTWPLEYQSLMARCWATQGDQRPTFAQACQELDVFYTREYTASHA